MNTLDQPSASMPAHASRYAISLHSQLVRQKRPGDKSLLDFPTTVATANRHHRRQRMRRTLASAERACANNVSTDATSSSLERSYVELLKDVVGVVSVISHVSSLRTRGRQAEVMKRTVTISNARDTGPTVDVVLWGERATAFPAEQIHRDSRSSPQIIVFVGTLVRSYADNVSLSGGSSCKWYINAPLPEVNALRASAETNHNPVIWDQGKAAAESTVIAVPEHKKLKDIKYLHPFENKKKEWLVVVKILKIDRSWWYNACKKCLRTTKPHGDTYKCTNNSCDSIGSPTPSSRGSNLFFGLAANSAVGHGSGVAQNRGAAFIREPSLTPESHKVSSSAKCNIQTTPHQGDNLLQGTEIITSPPNVQAPSGAAYSVLDGSTNKAHKSVVGKRSRTSPSKKVAKKLFRDEDTGDDDVAGSADVDAE
ncbi:putative replication protein [Zea mays]|uniref:Putative replication protein n=1 Tax=Zea mays TaxID=4577 RepID=A0A1D6MKE0_MAIZE|nr:putative replication protein [Zea mays]ONM29718.1 putative replication protein [Zea mays]